MVCRSVAFGADAVLAAAAQLTGNAASAQHGGIVSRLPKLGLNE